MEECPVCFELTHKRTICGHILCSSCSDRVNRCPLCRRFFNPEIQDILDISKNIVERIERISRELQEIRLIIEESLR